MIGRLLDENIAGFDMDLAVVQQHVDFAVENDCVIDGFGPVRIGVPRVALGRRIDAHRAQNFIVIDRRCMRTRRSEIDDTENGAVFRRRHAGRRLRAVR